MKKGTIFRNLWAGYETYFVYQSSVWSYKNEPPKVQGYGMAFVNGKWKVKKAQYYTRDLQNDTEHFPVVGHIDVDKVLIDAILAAIGERKDNNEAD